MSCLPPNQMPMEEQNRRIVLYPGCSIGVSQDKRSLAIVFESFDERHPCPTILCSEKDAVTLLLQMQASLQLLSTLPVPYTPLD